MNEALKSLDERVIEHQAQKEKFEAELKQEFNISPHSEQVFASSGGEYSHTNIKVILPESDYERAKQWMTKKFGEPEELEPWHPHHRKGKKVLHWKHLSTNLISMMQRKDKRYTMLGWL